MGWTDLVWVTDRWETLVNVVTDLWVTYNVRNFSTSWGSVSFSRRTLLHVVMVSNTTDRYFTWRWYNHNNTLRHTYQNTTMYWSITRWPAIMIFRTRCTVSPQLLLYLFHAIFLRCFLLYNTVNCHRYWAVLQYTKATEDTQHWCNIQEQIRVPFMTER